ncbi:MAG TPA: sulfurtransferase TusA family protein [Gammaproteobacteria bacterium]|nr:sulfurtransferase TusA family protein [Gammaproteobacteria bacterium]
MTQTVHTLDARGLNCPLPILRTKKALNTLETGEILEITATDPGSLKDLASFCNETGHELLSSEEREGCYVFHIKKQ